MPDLYEQNLTRAELLNLAEETLRKIDASAALRAQVISALHDPAVTRVAAGAHIVEGCPCPAVIAGVWGETTEQGPQGGTAFGFVFDQVVWDHFERVGRYILTITDAA